MSGETTEKEFVQRLRELLVSLPYDMKLLCEAVSDDYLPFEARRIAAAATIYCLSPSDPIPDTHGLLGFVDDAIITRIALQQLIEAAGDERERYTQRFPEQLADLSSDQELFAGYLGETLDWLKERFTRYLDRARYKGKDAATFASADGSGEFLYKEQQEFTTSYDIDEEAASRLRSGQQVLDLFRQRMEEGRRSR